MASQLSQSESEPHAPSDRTRVRRLPERGRYDRDSVHAILDDGIVAHVGFAVDGRPWVIPLAYARVGEHLYLHGAAANHALRALADGAEACVTVTHIDGLVLARSQFHHSINYRSVVVFGLAQRIDDDAEKRTALDAITEHVIPGRTADARAPSPSELRKTIVVRLPIDESSAKVRTGGPKDDDEDMDLPVWAGVIPMRLVADAPVSDPHTRVAAAPAYARNWRG